MHSLYLTSEKYDCAQERIQLYAEITVPTMRTFQQNFRLTRNAFEWLYNRIGPALVNNNGTGRSTIDAQKQLLAVLWIFSTPNS